MIIGFADIQGIIGAELPASALNHGAYWSNSPSHPLAKVWLTVGWRCPREGLSLGRKQVTLERCRPRTSSEATVVDGRPACDLQPSHAQVERVGVAANWRELVAQARVIPVALESTSDGVTRRFEPQGQYARRHEVELHRYGRGSFCRFSVPDNMHRPGVDFMVVGQRLAYVGRCEDFSRRFNHGYGRISPRNCYVGGQETKCRVNQLILGCADDGQPMKVYFIESDDYVALESSCIAAYDPPWNRRR